MCNGNAPISFKEFEEIILKSLQAADALPEMKNFPNSGRRLKLVEDVTMSILNYIKDCEPEPATLGHYLNVGNKALNQMTNALNYVMNGFPCKEIYDTPDSWESIAEDDACYQQFINHPLLVSPDKFVTIHAVERHRDTPHESICEVIRFNNDSRLAAMRFGGEYLMFAHVGDEDPERGFYHLTFIKEFPIQLASPVVQEIYPDEDISLLYGIERGNFMVVRARVSPDKETFVHYTPVGTLLWPASIPEDAQPVPENVSTDTNEADNPVMFSEHPEESKPNEQ